MRYLHAPFADPAPSNAISVRRSCISMAKVFCLGDVDNNFKDELMERLRECDSAVVLPGHGKSLESGILKGVALRLDGSSPDPPVDLFSPSWFSGISALKVDSNIAEGLLNDAEARQRALEALRVGVQSELYNTDQDIGPKLQAQENGKDTSEWIAGFDSPSCCLGLYASTTGRMSVPNLPGTEREQRDYYILCKAGAGVAAQEFHAMLTDAVHSGESLNKALAADGSPGLRALGRVQMASQRNRSRLLAQAAVALGFETSLMSRDPAEKGGSRVDTIAPSYQITTNSLTRESVTDTWKYCSGCVDTTEHTCIITASNVSDGMHLLTSPTNKHLNVRNLAWNTVPVLSLRLSSTQMSMERAYDMYVNGSAHPDIDWIRRHFSWSSKDAEFPDDLTSGDIPPPCFFGSHEMQKQTQVWRRELGLDDAQVRHMRPEIVCIAGAEPGKLRMLGKKLLKSSRS